MEVTQEEPKSVLSPDAQLQQDIDQVMMLLRDLKIDFIGVALYENGRPVMTPDGRHAVRVIPIRAQHKKDSPA